MPSKKRPASGSRKKLSQTPSKIKRHTVAKKSGMPGVNWNGSMWAWQVRCPKLGDKEKVVGRINRSFSISSFMKQGLAEDEADAAALEAAKAFRADLVCSGLLKEPKAKDPQFTSDVLGVCWDKVRKKWKVQLALKQKKGNDGPRQISGGYFAEKAAAEAKALELAQARAAGRFEGLRKVQKVPHPGVNWQVRPASGSRKRLRKLPLEEVEGEVETQVAEPLAMSSQTPSKIMRYKLAKQSGVPGVNWNGSMWSWEVKCSKLGDKEKVVGRINRSFSISSFMKQGLAEDEADAAALEAAKAFRADLIRQGVVKDKDPQFTSDVAGVTWRKAFKKWVVQLSLKGGERISGGLFAEKAAAEAKALELAEAHGLQRSVKAAGRFEELREVQPKVRYPGVTWEVRSQQWHAQIQFAGSNRNFTKKPKDFSENELERSFQEAVAWRKEQEKEREKLKEEKAERQRLTTVMLAATATEIA